MKGSCLTEMLVGLLLVNKLQKLLKFSFQGLHSCLFSIFSLSSFPVFLSTNWLSTWSLWLPWIGVVTHVPPMGTSADSWVLRKLRKNWLISLHRESKGLESLASQSPGEVGMAVTPSHTPPSHQQWDLRSLLPVLCLSATLLVLASACLHVFSIFPHCWFTPHFPLPNSEERSGWPPSYHHSFHRALCAKSHHSAQARLWIGRFRAGAGYVTWTLLALLESLLWGCLSLSGAVFLPNCVGLEGLTQWRPWTLFSTETPMSCPTCFNLT